MAKPSKSPILIVGMDPRQMSKLLAVVKEVYGLSTSSDGSLWPLLHVASAAIKKTFERLQDEASRSTLEVIGPETLEQGLFALLEEENCSIFGGRDWVDLIAGSEMLETLPLLRKFFPNLGIIHLAKGQSVYTDDYRKRFPVACARAEQGWSRCTMAWSRVQKELCGNFLDLPESVFDGDPSELTDALLGYLGGGEINIKAIRKLLSNHSRPKPTLAVVSHEASRTGAPLIILHIARRLVRDYGVSCIFLMVRGGELLQDFEALGPVYVLEKPGQGAQEGVQESLWVRGIVEQHEVAFALCNSMESRCLFEGFLEASVQILALVHEFPEPYPRSEIVRTFGQVEEVVVPSMIVRDSMVRKLGELPENLSVLPQGLFDKDFPKGDRREARRNIRELLGIPGEAFLVLGCGYVDQRKGCDLFINLAGMLQRRVPGNKVHFVWIGSLQHGQTSLQNYSFWIQMDVETAGLGGVVHFAGPQDDVAPWFLAADCLLMPSRQDPFPCVVLEAMAAELPVICFENATGAVDAIGHEGGFVIPYLDLNTACDRLCFLFDNPDEVRRIGAEGRARVLAEYDFDRYVADLWRRVCRLSPYLSSSVKGRVYVPCSDWSISGVNTLLETVGGRLRELGWDFQILFTHSRRHLEEIAVGGRVSWPQSIPYEYLLHPPNCDEEERLHHLLAFFKSQAPCIMLTAYDFNANRVATMLPDNVGLVSWNHSDEADYYDQMIHIGWACNAMINVSKEIDRKIVAMQPALTCKSLVATAGVREAEVLAVKPVREGPFRIIYTGRLVQYQKRVRDFADLAEALDRTGLDYSLTLIGESFDGSNTVLQKRLAAQIAMGRVRLPGRMTRSEIFDELAVSHCFVLVSDFEGLPISLLEGMSQGCVPVVAKMNSGISEVVADGRNGLIIDGRNYQTWAERITRMAEDPAEVARLSAEARETIRQRFTVESLANRIDSLLSGVRAEITFGRYTRSGRRKIPVATTACV